MPQYALRNVDPTLWSKFTERANGEGWPTRALIVGLIGGLRVRSVCPFEAGASRVAAVCVAACPLPQGRAGTGAFLPRNRWPVPVATGLTLRAIAHIGEGADLQNNRRAFQFEVLGLPPEQQAWIADFDGDWRVLQPRRSAASIQRSWAFAA
jgi:hypothetical protein